MLNVTPVVVPLFGLIQTNVYKLINIHSNIYSFAHTPRCIKRGTLLLSISLTISD